MTYDRFKQLWTALVTHRAPAEGTRDPIPYLNNGVSEETVDALVAVADGDHSQFDGIQTELTSIDAKGSSE